MQRIWNIKTAEINDEVKQSFVDYFFHLMWQAKEKPKLIWKNFARYKIMHPHCDSARIDRNEIFEEILYANYIDERMRSVAETVGNIKAMQNYFR